MHLSSWHEPGLQNYCAKPDKCFDFVAKKKISGQGGCPVLAVNDPVSPSPKVVITTIRSFTDINGRPTAAREVLTIEDPSFTGNTDFSGSRPTGAAGTGGVALSRVVSVTSTISGLLALAWVLAQ